MIVREQDMMDQARQSRQILLFEPDFIKNQNQIGCFLTGSNLPARLVWIDTIFCLFSLFLWLSLVVFFLVFSAVSNNISAGSRVDGYSRMFFNTRMSRRNDSQTKGRENEDVEDHLLFSLNSSLIYQI